MSNIEKGCKKNTNYKQRQSESKEKPTMATDVLDEHRFTSQCSLYEPPTRSRLTKESKRRPTTASTATIYETVTTSTTTRHRRVKYSTQTGVSSNHSTNNSIHNRHSVSNDFLSLFRSFAMKPFKTSSMTNAMIEGQTNNIIGGNQINSKPSVSLLKFRPLSDSVTDHTSYTQSTRVCIQRICVRACICRRQKQFLLLTIEVKLGR